MVHRFLGVVGLCFSSLVLTTCKQAPPSEVADEQKTSVQSVEKLKDDGLCGRYMQLLDQKLNPKGQSKHIDLKAKELAVSPLVTSAQDWTWIEFKSMKIPKRNYLDEKSIGKDGGVFWFSKAHGYLGVFETGPIFKSTKDAFTPKMASYMERLNLNGLYDLYTFAFVEGFRSCAGLEQEFDIHAKHDLMVLMNVAGPHVTQEVVLNADRGMIALVGKTSQEDAASKKTYSATVYTKSPELQIDAVFQSKQDRNDFLQLLFYGG